jgi:hypothetical protein
MDPAQTFNDMFAAMRDGNEEEAREHALNLKQWLDKGGCVPYNISGTEFVSYTLSVLRRTAHLESA